jgi:hypothetical protein
MALLGGLFAVPLAGVVWVLLGAAYRNAVAEPPATRRWSLPTWRRGMPSTSHAGTDEIAGREEVR